MFKFEAHFPLMREISAISFVCDSAEEALIQWNNARAHDGLPPDNSIPSNTLIEVLEYDDHYEGVYIDYSDNDFTTLLKLPETMEEQLKECEKHILEGQDNGHFCRILDMSSFKETTKTKSFAERELERIHQHNESLAWLLTTSPVAIQRSKLILPHDTTQEITHCPSSFAYGIPLSS